MMFGRMVFSLVVSLLLLHATVVNAAVTVDLRGYADSTGAITILNGGDTTDPYFAMQALLLAHDNGLDVSVPAEKFANWLLPYQKPDGTFDRFDGEPIKTGHHARRPMQMIHCSPSA